MGDVEVPLVSVNIPTYNSARTIRECLESVDGQTYPRLEVIIVDSYSQDKTVDIAEEHGAKILNERGLPKQRMLGIEKSKGEFILLLDSDQVLASPDVVERCVRKCQEGHDALILFEDSIYDERSLVARMIADNLWIIQRDADPVLGTALPRFFRASFLQGIDRIPEDIGYFDHAFIYHEVVGMNAKVGRVNGISIHHHEVETWSQVIRKFFRYYGSALIPALRANRRLVIGRSAPRRAFFSRDVLTRPTLFAGLSFLYLVKVIAAGIGVVSSLIRLLAHGKLVK